MKLGLRVEFDADAFDVAAIGALIELFQRVLDTMTADPTLRPSSMDVLESAERDPIDPEAIALTFRGRSLTYGELDEDANRLANLLAVYGARMQVVLEPVHDWAHAHRH